MTGNEKITVGIFVMTGLIIVGAWLDNNRSVKPTTFHELVNTVPAQPVATPAVTIPVVTERYYRDRLGAVVPEKKMEKGLEEFRQQIQAMPDNALRAFKEGQLQALEKEWARIKQTGPVEPLRAVDGSGKEILIGEAPLPESQRRRIFYELVQAQDSGVGDREAYTLVAKRHGIPEMMLNEIAYEGAAKKWPMP